MELAVFHFDVSRIKPGKLTPLPPIHAHGPFIRIEAGLAELSHIGSNFTQGLGCAGLKAGGVR
jgi:hypothetical protein